MNDLTLQLFEWSVANAYYDKDRDAWLKSEDRFQVIIKERKIQMKNYEVSANGWKYFTLFCTSV